ncbi:MAG: AAA family ATPase, partial [Ruminococcus sp.]|nr:AAA family ATPase [Candidatus Apopatosoma intestinale]
MIIKHIYIQSFGKIQNLHLDLSDGVNILTGDNESGKSTICGFIRFLFYGLSRHPDDTSMISWETGRAAGYLIYSENGKEYRIERDATLVASSAGKASVPEKEAVVYDAESGAPILRDKCPGNVLFGVPDAVFDATAYIRQIGDKRVGGEPLNIAIENILFSADESVNTKKALDTLTKARKGLGHIKGSGGRISELTEKRDELENRLEEAMESSARIIWLSGRGREISEAIEKAEREAGTVADELARYERYTIKRTYRKCEEERREAKEMKQRLAELEDVKTADGISLSSEEFLSRLRKDQNELQVASARFEDACTERENTRKKLGEMADKIAAYERFGSLGGGKREEWIAEARSRKQKFMIGRIIAFSGVGATALFAVLLLLSFALSGSLSSTGIVFSLLTGIGLLAAVAGFLFCAVQKGKITAACRQFGCRNLRELEELIRAAKDDETVIAYITQSKAGAENRYGEASDRLDSINNRIVTELERSGFPIRNTTGESLSDAIACCEEKHAEVAKLELLLKEKKAQIDADLASLAAYSEEYVTAAVEEKYSKSVMESFDVSKKKRDLEFLRNSAASSRALLHEIDKEYSVLCATNPNPGILAPEKEIVEDEIRRLTEKYDAYLLAYQAMQTASGKLREGLSPKLSKIAGNVMS